MIIRTLLLCFLFAQVSTETFAQIHASSFASKVDFAVGTTNPGRIASADFDLDGKTDVAVTNTSGSGISVFRNTGTSGLIDNSLLGTQQIVNVSSSVIEIRAEDLDNDGKADLIVATYGTTNIHVLRNTSTTGNISFAASQNLIAGSDPSTLDINDFDGDGKKEIAAGNFGSNTFSVFRNTSSSGAISFAAKQDFTTSSVSANQTREMISDDLDGDGKKDLAVLYYNGYVSLFRNTSALGTVSFAGSVNLTAMSLNAGICAGDIDGDGKSEIVVSYNNGSSAMLFKNNSSTGTLAFSSFVTITTGSQPYYNTLTDLDGDGKPELIFVNRGSNTISIFKNMATVGTVNASSFATKVDFTTGNNPLGFALSDLNNDGKRELIIANNGSNGISILKNQVVVGLIAHYPLDGNGNDLGAYTLNGTLLSGATAATSRYLSSNASLQFDGTSNARMLTATSPAFSISAMKGLSVSLWIKPDNVVPSPANRIIYLFNDGTRTSELFFNYSAKNLIVSNWNGSSSPYFITPTKVFSANTWYHVVVTIESLSSASQQLSLYVNDTLQFTQAVTMSKPGASSFQLSKHHVNDWNFSGGIDDVRIYNTALSATEVHNLYIIDMPKKTYYSKSTGNLNQLSTWGTNTDGSGTAPLSFDSSNVTYQVKNNTNPVTGGSFKISGANSTLILGDGTNAFNLALGSNDTLSCDSVYLNNNITLTVQGSFS
ncbi:MAG: FG-GAP-like repeat-containing protein, partial [Bacteroidota bacterium]